MRQSDREIDSYRRGMDLLERHTRGGLSPKELDAVRREVVLGSHRDVAPRIRWWWAAAGLAATAALLILLAIRFDDYEVDGRLQVVMRSGRVALDGDLTQSIGTIVSTKPHFRLGQNGRVGLCTADDARISVGGPADLTVSDSGRRVLLRNGEIALSVPKGRLHEPLRIIAQDAEVLVRGTMLAVGVENDRLDWVHVHEGKVEVHAGDGSGLLVLGEGEQYLAPGAAYEDSVDYEDLEAPWWPDPERDEVDREHGKLTVRSIPAGAMVHLNGEPVGPTPVVLRWPEGTVSVEATKQGFVPWRGDAEVRALDRTELAIRLRQASKSAQSANRSTDSSWSGITREQVGKRVQEGRCEAAKELTATLSRQSLRRTEQAQDWMLVAECFLRRGNKKAALSLYRRVADDYAHTPSAESALFEVGKILAEQSRPNQALSSFDTYLRRYGARGRLAEPVMYRRCELLLELGDLQEAQRCLTLYQQKHPHGARADQISLLMGSIARAQQRYDEAIHYFGHYLLTAKDVLKREKAAYARLVCMRRVGHPELARALESYLREFSRGEHIEEVRGWLTSGQ